MIHRSKIHPPLLMRVPRLQGSTAGFALAEVLTSVALVAMVSAFAYGCLLSANRFAMQSRLQTLAQGIARDRVDRVQSITPYNPHLPQPQIPADLELGTRVEEDVPLYVDPATDKASVTARIRTTVSDAGAYHTRLAVVTVQYTFAGKQHEVRMNTFRTSDS
jgi:hypothetical protein